MFMGESVCVTLREPNDARRRAHPSAQIINDKSAWVWSQQINEHAPLSGLHVNNTHDVLLGVPPPAFDNLLVFN